MTTTSGTDVNPRLKALTDAGVSVWLDQLSHELVAGGELARLISEESLRGVTSNPSIFEKSILGGHDYDATIAKLAADGKSSEEIYDALVIADVQAAADVLRSVYDASGNTDGFVSLEVLPRLARDTEKTIAAAKNYWGEVGKPNLMIKIPGTPEGLPAIEEAIYSGINVNVTLLFATEAYDKVIDAYITGLERRHAEGKPLLINSVASFFVSRVDSAVDKELGDDHDELHGKAALANARAAYQLFQQRFSGERWEKLAAAGAVVQRPLWASTGVKNPDYPDTLYVDGLVAPHTVNTMPPATLKATAEQSEFNGATAEEDPTEILSALKNAGIDLGQVTDDLLTAGIKQFADAFDTLLAGIDDQRKAALAEKDGGQGDSGDDDRTAELDKLSIDTIRVLAIDAVQKANQGHPGAPMGLAPVTYTLFTRLLKHNPTNPSWIDRDRFILSAGHASMLLYATLHLAGYPISLEDIEHFRDLGWPTAGHPERWDVPGIEATTGPLGQGISTSVGLALGEAWLAENFNTPDHTVVDHHTWVIASDGDIQEGISSEASSLAGHLGLGKLIVFYDDNKIQLASPTAAVISEDTGARYEAYGWQVLKVGYDRPDSEDLHPDELEAAAKEALAETGKPTLIMVRSHIGYGSPNKQDTTSAHGAALGEDEVRLTKEAYGWDPDGHFEVPAAAAEHWRQGTVERGRELEDSWDEVFAAYKAADPEKASALERIIGFRSLPAGWADGLPKFDAGDKDIATRAASGKVIQWAAGRVPEMVGGSADLASSNNTNIDDGGDVDTHAFGGRNIHYGVREHAMGAITNGLTLHGLRAFGGTFFTFSDYMRGAVRLGALMKVPSIWVWTHDSIGLGSDGPTHQPVEHLAACRAIPNLNVVRPADANETALAWRFALNQTTSPTAFALSRQNLPILDPAAIPDDAIDKGAYVYSDPDGGDTPELILIATGSEVSLIIEAAATLTGEGIKTRVVSAPSLDSFAAADKSYRDSVLLPEVKARIAVEAAVRLGWDRWIGPEGEFIGMEGFGASGSAEAVYDHFGITAEHVVSAGRELVQRFR